MTSANITIQGFLGGGPPERRLASLISPPTPRRHRPGVGRVGGRRSDPLGGGLRESAVMAADTSEKGTQLTIFGPALALDESGRTPTASACAPGHPLGDLPQDDRVAPASRRAPNRRP